MHCNFLVLFALNLFVCCMLTKKNQQFFVCVAPGVGEVVVLKQQESRIIINDQITWFFIQIKYLFSSDLARKNKIASPRQQKCVNSIYSNKIHCIKTHNSSSHFFFYFVSFLLFGRGESVSFVRLAQ